MESHQEEGPSSEAAAYSQAVSSPKANSLNWVQDHLQSLRLVVNNGEARFGLDKAAANAGGNTDFSIIDAEDPASFVVLGRGSMESIEASCLASYMDIQHKSVSVDYNSMISSLDTNDVHQKLMEVLQENGRLKEALKQNNTAMKEQISTLTSWQEEMMKVHREHKNKFAETMELNKYLKNENCELKMKLSMDQYYNPETGFNIIDINACRDRQDCKSTSIEHAQQKVASIEDDVITSQLKCKELSNEVRKLLTLSDILDSEIEETASVKEKNQENIPTLVDILDSENKETASIQEKNQENIPILVDILDSENKETASVQENLQGSISDSTITKRRMQDFIEYIIKLDASLDFFEATKYKCEKIIKGFNDAIRELKGKLSNKKLNLDINNYMDILSGSYKRPQERLMAVELQSELNSILSQYETTLCDLISYLRGKPSVISDASESETATGKSELEMKRSQEENIASLTILKEVLWEEKLLIDEKKSLEIERKKLFDERDLMTQKMISLSEEKTSLDRQSQLYETSEKALQAHKKELELKCNTLASEIELMRTMLANRESEQTGLQKKIKHQEETIYSLQVQMKVYEEDFTRERKFKDALLLDHNKIVADLVSQMEFSMHLQSQLAAFKTNRESPSEIQSPQILSISCPKCQCVFRDASAIQEHVEVCLDLH